MVTDIVEFELLLLNNDPSNSRVILELAQKRTAQSLSAHSFEAGLRTILFDAFRRMINLNIERISGTGAIKKRWKYPKSLAEIIEIDDETTRIETHDGYKTLSSYSEGHVREIEHALMLLVWKWSPHFASDGMEGTNDFSSSMRACVVRGRTQHGKGTGQRIGGFKVGFDPSPTREIIVYPNDQCFNPECFSHEIERMIDPTYVFIPPKPGEDLETDLAKTLGNNVVKKDHPVEMGVVKKDSQKDPAVRGFERDMCE